VRYLDDGRLSIDNNLAERLLRGIAVTRKNFLFRGSDTGGERAAIIYTIAETAKLNGHNPEAYIAMVLDRLAKGHFASRIDDLLPWNLTQDSRAVGNGCRLRRGQGFVDEHELAWVEIGLTLASAPGLAQDVGPRRAKKGHSVVIAAFSSALASSARISISVMSGVRSTRQRISGAWASIRPERRSPPRALGATEPVSRSRAHQRIALAMLTPQRAAAPWRDVPSATAVTTGSPNLTESAFDVPVALQHRQTD